MEAGTAVGEKELASATPVSHCRQSVLSFTADSMTPSPRHTRTLCQAQVDLHRLYNPLPLYCPPINIAIMQRNPA